MPDSAETTAFPPGAEPPPGGRSPHGEAESAQPARNRPRARERGRMRRRLREQKRMREALLLDLGALVYELHRHGRREPELLQAKAAELTAVDQEVRGLVEALDANDDVLALVAAGIAGSCERCGSLLSTDARYCGACGAPAVPAIGGPPQAPAGPGLSGPAVAQAPAVVAWRRNEPRPDAEPEPDAEPGPQAELEREPQAAQEPDPEPEADPA
ncbi:MAG: hypothetical protein M3356_04720, partial [Actinomycetota bacterium]|nr:hypothetical protein [Actinomycetota bacterium]